MNPLRRTHSLAIRACINGDPAKCAFATLLLLFAHPKALAQLPTADLSRIEPRAVRVGQTIEVDLHGQNLEELTELRFTHPGISATPVLRPTDEFFPTPRIDGSKFTVVVAKEVPPGTYEARAVGYFGLSTARPFLVAPADSNEANETGGNNDRESAMLIELNSVITGAVASRQIDWFKFNAKAGQKLLVEVHAERIDSRLDSQLILYDSQGREIDRNRDTFGRDAFLAFQPKQDGEFYVALSDILYRGGDDHFYRLSLSDRPHVDFVFPPAGMPGSTNRYTLYGHNLPGGVTGDGAAALQSVEVEIALPREAATPVGFVAGPPRQGILPGFDFQLPEANRVRIGLATAPVVIEVAGEEAQQVSVPSEVAGRFDKADDEDTYRFPTLNGTTYSLEVIADRMGFPVDPYLIVHQVTTGEDGKETLTQVADSDDMPSFFSVDGKDSINADTTDAALRFESAHDGDYQVTVVNQLGDGGMTHLYRLAIREPLPDFRLIATTERPLATNRAGYSVAPHLRQGAKWGIRILCPRQDGFEGDIVVTAEDLPEGVSAKSLTLSAKTDRGFLVVAVDSNAESWSGDVRIVGRAIVGETELVREARFACLVWGHIFADSIRVRSRLTERIPLSVNERESAPVAIAPIEDKEWSVEVGKPLELPIKVTDHGSRVGNLTIEPRGLFGMLRSPPNVNVAEQESEGTLTINFARNGNFLVEPGRYQFALHGTGVMKYQHNQAASARGAAEQGRIEKLAMEVAKVANQAKVDADEVRKIYDAAKQKVANTANGEARVIAQTQAEKAKTAMEVADKATAAAAERLKAAEKAKAEIAKIAKAAADKAAEKNINFAAWSDLITVVVVEPKKGE